MKRPRVPATAAFLRGPQSHAPLTYRKPSLARWRFALSGRIAPLAILLASAAATFVQGALVLTPTDQIIGGRLQGTSFTVGTTGGAGNTWPGNEEPRFAIDGGVGKYLNFGMTGTGVLVTPAFDGGAGSVISSMQLWTANDAVERDPSSYQIWGTNAGLNPVAGAGSVFDTASFTLVATGNLALPAGRNLTGLNVANSQTVAFANTNSYRQYMIVFPTIKGPGGNSMQIGELQLSGVRSSDVLTWTGSTDGVWDVNGKTNWITAGSVVSAYHDDTALTFNDTPTNRTITIQNGGTAVTPASMTFVHNNGSYTIGGNGIASPGTLSLIGTGEVILNALANFATGTVVNAGKLTVGATGSLGNGALTVNNQSVAGGGITTVTLNSPHTVGSLASTVSGTNAANLVLGGTLTVEQANTSDFQGRISGVGGLTKNGTAILNLTSANSYQGPTVVNAGILQSSRPNDEPFSALPAGQPVIVNAGGILALGATDGLGYYEGKVSSLTVNGGTVIGYANTHSTLPAVTLNGGTLTAVDAGHLSSGTRVNYILDGNVITVPDGGTSYIKAAAIRLRNKPDEASAPTPVIFTVPRGGAGTVPDLVITSKIEDTGAGFIKNGNGVLVMANASTATGPTVIENGTLQVANSNALGTGPVTIGAGTVLSLAPQSSVTGFDNVSLNGGATLNGGTVTLTDGIGNEARTVFGNIPMPVTGGFTASFTYTATPGADGAAFVLQGVSPNVVGTAGNGLAYATLENAAGLLFNIYTTPGTAFSTTGTTGNYVGTGGVSLTGGPVNVTVVYDPVNSRLTETLTAGATYSRIFEGVNLQTLFGTSPVFVGFTGATGGATSTQTIANFLFNATPQALTLANNISVPANATSGIELLRGQSDTSIATTAVIQGEFKVEAGARLNVTGGAAITDSPYALTVTGVSGIGEGATISVANNGTGVGEIALGDVAGLSGTANLTKAGPGTLTILGSASYLGATVVNGGTLAVNGSISGATTINSGTLTGVGTLKSVTINGDGILAPGSGISGIATGPLFMKDGSTLRVEMDATNADIVLVDGAVNLAGTINLAISLAGDPVNNTRFTLLDGSAPLVGYAAGARFSYFGSPIEQGGVFEVPGSGFSQFFTIDYAANGGADVVLTAVPEPGSGVALLAGLGAVLGVRRRRR